jgi:hypothetical protein
MPAEILRVEPGHESERADCAIVSLSVYLDVPYTDVIRVAARVVEDGGRHGLVMPVVKRIARLCGAPLRVSRRFDADEAFGIVWVEREKDPTAHCAVLRWGQVLDRAVLWPWDAWLAAHHATADDCVLLVAKDA